MFSGLEDIWKAIQSIPTLIADVLKTIFIPDMDELKMEFTNLLNSISPMSSSLAADSLFPNYGGDSPDDVYYDLNAGYLHLENLKIVSYSYLSSAVEFFRPIINGFLVFLLGLYWYKEFLSFIGQAPNMASAKNSADEHIKKEGK